MSSRLKAKTTIYLNPHVKKFVQHKAIEENRSISVIINNKLADMLEDLADQRAKGIKNKKTARFESVLKRAGLSYDDLRD